MDTSEALKHLQLAISQIETVKRLLLLSDTEAVPPPQVADGICLYCKKPILAGERAHRGVHDKCNIKRKRRGYSDAEAISKGWLGPKRPGGRPADPVPDAAVDVEKQIADVDKVSKTTASRKTKGKTSK